MAAVLVVDDEPNIRILLERYVRGLGHDVSTAVDGEQALAIATAKHFDVVLSDVRMAGIDGLRLLRELRARSPQALVVLMTAYATVPQAVEAIRAGAYDYLVKPFASIDQIGLVLDRATELIALRGENQTLRGALGRPVLLDSRSARMQRVLRAAREAAATDATVLLGGESGTGKGVLAAAIHGWSARASAPFTMITCTTLSEPLLESDLFGHVKGAFTGAWKDKPGRLEGAAGGTVFLDEIGELPPALQAKLLRFLEERRFERVGGTKTLEIDVRVVAATNRRLDEEVSAGRFRADLFYRLNVVAIDVPPLRDRVEDLPALARHLLGVHAARYGRGPFAIDDDALAMLVRYPWPGNVRELANALEHAVVVSRGDRIGVEALPDRFQAPTASAPEPALAASSLDEVERRHIERVLADSATLEEAAARLGISSTTLWRKRKRYRID